MSGEKKKILGSKLEVVAPGEGFEPSRPMKATGSQAELQA
jgi:hypothetical protein